MVSTVSESNKQLIREAFERSPLAGAPESEHPGPYAPHCVFHGAAEMFRGSTPDRDYSQAFPDLRMQIDDLIAEEDRVVTCLSGSGTHRGVFRGVPPSGHRRAVRVIVISRIEDAHVVEEWGTLNWE